MNMNMDRSELYCDPRVCSVAQYYFDPLSIRAIEPNLKVKREGTETLTALLAPLSCLPIFKEYILCESQKCEVLLFYLVAFSEFS